MLLAVGFMILMSLAAGAYARFTQELVAALTGEDGSGFLFWAPFILVGLTIVRGVSSYLRQIVVNGATAAMEVDLRGDLLRRLLHADLVQLEGEAAASFATRFSADLGVIQGAVQTAFNALAMILIIVSTLGFMLSINWQMTLSFLGVLGLAVVPVMLIGAKLRQLSARTQREIGRMMAAIVESLGGIRLVRTYRLEDRMMETGQELFESLRKLRMKQVDAAARIEPMMEILGGLAIAVLLVMLLTLFRGSDTLVADFVGLLTGMGVITPQAQRLGKVYAGIQQGAAALERLYGVLDRETLVVDAPDAEALAVRDGAVTFSGVGFVYPDGTRAIDDFELSIAPGETVALVGPSGAGKSTIFSLLARLYDPTEGRIAIDGQDIRGVTLESLRGSLALVSQDTVMLSGTVMDNIRMGRQDATDDEVIAAARAANAHEFIEALPEGYATRLTPDGGGFSGGQRQRLSIARAILRDAPILMLDEPTSALDAASEHAVKQSLDALSDGRTTLVIAHRLSTIMNADRIAVMQQGRVVQIGSHADLLKEGGLYADFHAMQAGGAG